VSRPGLAVYAANAAPAERRASGRQAWGLLWAASRPLSAVVAAWLVASALLPALVVITLGEVVGAVPAALAHGLGSPDGGRLVLALAVAAVVYGLSLMLGPVGTAVGTAAKARITTDLQDRLMTAVCAPVGIEHLEDPEVLDRLSRAEGTLTGYFPGDAPVTWAGALAARLSGVLGCVVVALNTWWLGVGLAVMWWAVRRFVLAAVVRQATELRGQTPAMRRAWNLMSVGSTARDAKEIRVFGLADFLAGRFRAEYRDAIRAGIGGLRSLHLRAGIGFVVVLAGYAIALLTIAEQARSGAIGLRSLAILLPMLAVTASTGNISVDDITLAWTLAGLPDVRRLETELAVGERALTGAHPVTDLPRQRVRLESVVFRYPTGANNVLDGVDLELVAGTSTAIVGVNGAGKSTLVGLLSRLRDPTGGRITVDGVDIRDLDPTGWQRRIAVMPQDPARYPFTAYDNIALGAVEHRDDRDGIEQAARTAGFAEVVDTLPHGWQTVLSRELPDGADLSGGQWQRLALARALFATRHGARLLILDEPTAALDIRGEARFYQRFFDITHGLTTVVISHRFATVRQADVICVLDGGRITERGSHPELLAAGGAYARLYRTQARRFGGNT
jgi:ATP-binding cassette subfamily B protein